MEKQQHETDRVMSWPEWRNAEVDFEREAKQWREIAQLLEINGLQKKLSNANSTVIDLLIRESALKARIRELEGLLAVTPEDHLP